MNCSFKLLLYIMKLNLKGINSFVVSILVTSCENRQALLSRQDKSSSLIIGVALSDGR